MGRILLRDKSTGEERLFEPGLAQEALRSNQFESVNTEAIVLGDGRTVSADQEIVREAIPTGARGESTDENIARVRASHLKKKFDRGLASEADAALQGATDVATLGISALARNKSERFSAQQTAEFSPRARLLGEIAALAVPTGRFTPLGALTKVARKAGSKAEAAAIRKLSERGLGASRVGSQAAKLGTEGLIEGFGVGAGMGVSGLALSDDDLTVENIIGAAGRGGLFGALAGGAIGAGGGALSGVLKNRAAKLGVEERKILGDAVEVSAHTPQGKAVIDRVRGSVGALDDAHLRVADDLDGLMGLIQGSAGGAAELKALRIHSRAMKKARDKLNKFLGKGSKRAGDEQMDFVLFRSTDSQTKGFQRALRDYHQVTDDAARAINSKAMDGLDETLKATSAQGAAEGGVLAKMDALDAVAAADMMGIADISDFSGDLGPVAELLLKGRAISRHGAAMVGGKAGAIASVATKASPAGGFLNRVRNLAENATQRSVGINVARRSAFKGGGTGGVVEATARDTLAGLQGAAAGALTKDIIAGGGQIQKAAVKQQALARKATRQFLQAKKITRKLPKAMTLAAMKFDFGIEDDTPKKRTPPNANKKGVEFLRVKGELSRAMGNPEATKQHFRDRFEAVKYINARTYDKLLSKSFSQMAWLHSELPSNPGIGTATNGYSDYVPPDHEIESFQRKAAIVSDPTEAMNRFREGTITLDEVQALRAAWPDRYQDIVMSIVERLPELKEELSYDRRVSLSIFTGVPIDSTLRGDFVASIQAMYAEEQPEKPKGSTKNFDPDKIGKEVVQNTTTSAQRLTAKR